MPATQRAKARTTSVAVRSADKLTIKEAEKIVGAHASQWHGNCFGIASKLAPVLGGTAVYGHWLGQISPKATFWKNKMNLGFAQHGWIVLPNASGKYIPEQEQIVDPTRWSFEAKQPYLWTGDNDGTYDEGGNGFRSAMASLNSRADDPEHNREPVLFELRCEEYYERVKRICRISGFEDFSDEYPFLDHMDVLRLCNAPPRTIGWFIVAEIYEKLARAGYHAHIPTDNWKMVDRYFGISENPGSEDD